MIGGSSFHLLDWDLNLKAGIEGSRPAFEPKRGGHTEEKTGKLPQSGVSICKTLIPESITLGHHGVTHLNAFTVFLFSNFGHLPFFLKSLFCP